MIVAADAFVKQQLEQFVRKRSGKTGFIICPFHPDTDASCHVTLESTRGLPAGVFHCFGCGEGGGYNKLAEKLGIQPIDDLNVMESVPGLVEQRIALSKNPPKAYYDLPWSEPVPTGFVWRGIPAEFLNAWGCKFGPDPMEWISGQTTGEKRLYLFTKDRSGRHFGWIASKLPDSKIDEPKYFNMPGVWSSRAFLPNLMGMTDRVVLVEGPYDAFRLLHLGIPAMCIMGVQSWNVHKISLLVQACFKKIVILGDGDRGGYSFNENAAQGLGIYGLGTRINLPLTEQVMEGGQLKKMDPGNMPEPWVEYVRQVLNAA